jgi:hypothetical protein
MAFVVRQLHNRLSFGPGFLLGQVMIRASAGFRQKATPALPWKARRDSSAAIHLRHWILRRIDVYPLGRRAAGEEPRRSKT